MIVPDTRLFCIVLPMLVIVSETWHSLFAKKKKPGYAGLLC
jgi:hypothetical protein